MATIFKRETGYRVQIRRKGHRSISRTFLSKKTALEWARLAESKLERGFCRSTQVAESTSLKEILDLYSTSIAS